MATIGDARTEFDKSLSDLEMEVYNGIQDKRAESASATASVLRDASAGVSKIVREFVKRAVEQHEEDLYALVCEKLDYCNVVKSEKFQISLGVADAIVTAKMVILTTLPIPVLRIAVYMIRENLLDSLCQCKASQEKVI